MAAPPDTSAGASPRQTYPEDFYFGIPGEPRLIARSDHLWNVPPISNSGDWMKPVPVHIWPVGLNHPIVDVYERLYPDIQECCHGLDWRVISCYRIGWKSAAEQNPVVIWVFLNQIGPSDSAAKDAVRAICDILSKNCLSDVQVHVAEPRSDQNTVEVDERLPPYIKSTYCVNPPVGSSIGIEGGNAAGSVGLFLKFHDEEQGRTWYGGLTCHTVAHNASDMFAPVAWIPQSSPHRLQVTCPANKDHLAYLHSIKLASDRCQSRVQPAKRKKEMAQSGNNTATWSVFDQETLEEYEADISNLAEESQRASNFFETSRQLGSVVASSGLAEPPSDLPMMDWSLLRIDEARCPGGLSNTIPPLAVARFKKLMTAVGHREGVTGSWVDLADRITRARGDVIDMNEINKRMRRCAEQFRVFHLGRSSGPAVGHLNEIRDGVRTPYVQENGEKRHLVSREYVVLNYVPVASMYAGEIPPFSRAGDAGSSVVDADGRVLGILFAGGEKDKSRYPASWVTPVAMILEEIKASMPAGLALSVA